MAHPVETHLVVEVMVEDHLVVEEMAEADKAEVAVHHHPVQPVAVHLAVAGVAGVAAVVAVAALVVAA